MKDTLIACLKILSIIIFILLFSYLVIRIWEWAKWKSNIIDSHKPGKHLHTWEKK